MIAVCILNIVNTVGLQDGKVAFNVDDPQATFLAYAGKSVSPIFAAFGVKKDNRPASVALFTGLFAKETIVGTVNALYASMGAPGQENSELSARPSAVEAKEPDAAEEQVLNIVGTLVESVNSVKDGLIGVCKLF